MVGRPFWSGQLKISLVSFGIQFYPAVNPQSGITFHQIDKSTGERVRHMNVVNRDEPVENAEIVKGYEYTKGKYIAIDPEEIKRLRVPAKREMQSASSSISANCRRRSLRSPILCCPIPSNRRKPSP